MQPISAFLGAALLPAIVLGLGGCGAEPSASPEVTLGKVIRGEGGAVIDEETVRTARETASHSMDTPVWTNPEGFGEDVFTFVRVVFQSEEGFGPGVGFGRRLGWWVDYPDADLNLSFRLQDLTSIRTDPDARVVRLTDPDLGEYPMLYLEHPGYMRLRDAEIGALRGYLTGGGVLFVNDFWSEVEWEGFASQMARVLPGRAWTELGPDHPVFRCVFPLEGPMHRWRVPTMQFWNEAFDADDPRSDPHTIFRGAGSDEMHVRALHDDAGRIVVLAIHNSDVSDGWERENEDNRYFRRYSERIAYPLAFNVVFHLMSD